MNKQDMLNEIEQKSDEIKELKRKIEKEDKIVTFEYLGHGGNWVNIIDSFTGESWMDDLNNSKMNHTYQELWSCEAGYKYATFEDCDGDYILMRTKQ